MMCSNQQINILIFKISDLTIKLLHSKFKKYYLNILQPKSNQIFELKTGILPSFNRFTTTVWL